jgi:hypothetical protein
MKKGLILSLRPFLNDRTAAQLYEFAAAAPRPLARAAFFFAACKTASASGYTLTS